MSLNRNHFIVMFALVMSVWMFVQEWQNSKPYWRRNTMCNAFSAIVTKNKKVYWKAGMDSHEELIKKFKIDETVPKEALKSNKEVAKHLNFAKVEISPQNEDYLNPDKWVYSVDEAIKPDWVIKEHEQKCQAAFKLWKKEVYTFNIKEARKPIHPFKIKPPKITEKHLDLVKQWDSVGASVGAYVGD